MVFIPEFVESQHPRGGKGTREGGRFVRKGSAGTPVAERFPIYGVRKKEMPTSSEGEVAKKFGFTPSEVRAIGEYINDSTNINNWYRHGRKGAVYEHPSPTRRVKLTAEQTALLDQHIDALNSALQKSAVPEDTVVFRGISMCKVSRQMIKEGRDGTLIGKSIELSGFASTTTDQDVADEFVSSYSSPVVMQITLPKGTNALDMQPFARNFAKQRELLIGEGTLEVTGVLGEPDEIMLVQGTYHAKRAGEEPVMQKAIDYKQETFTETADRLHKSSLKGPLTAAEDKSITTYTGKVGWQINEYLRHPDDEAAQNGFTATAKRVLKDLDAVMDKTALAENVTTYRGLNAAGWKAFAREKVGGIVSDPGFASTTLDPDIARQTFDTGGGVLQIECAKGAKVLPISESSVAELLINRGSQYEVTEVDRKGKRITLRLVDESTLTGTGEKIRGREGTRGATEKDQIFAKGYIAGLKKEADSTAKEMGVDPSMIKIMAGVPRTDRGMVQALYNAMGPKPVIEVYPMVGEPNAIQLRGLLGHEICHHQYRTVVNAWANEPRDGPVRSVMKDYDILRSANHANEAKKISDYAKEHWDLVMKGYRGADAGERLKKDLYAGKVDATVAVSETLAEIARLKVEGNTSSVSKWWMDHFDAMQKCYAALQKKKKT